MLGTGLFLKIAKLSSRKTQKIANSQKINSRKNFVRHVLTIYELRK